MPASKRGANSIIGKFSSGWNCIHTELTAANLAHRFGTPDEAARHMEQAARDCEILARQIRDAAEEIKATREMSDAFSVS